MSVSRRDFVRATSFTAGAAALLPRDVLGAEGTRAATAAADLGDWAAVQRLFDLSPEWVHASLFYLASHPRPVREAVERRRRELDANPHDTVEHQGFGPVPGGDMEAAVVALARYLGASPDEIALTNNTTGGLALVHNGLPLREGDEVLTTAHDHVVHHEAIRLATARRGATWRRIELFPPHQANGVTAASLVDTLRKGIGPKTRVLAVTWVHSSSGLKLPVADVAAMLRDVNASRSEKILLVVDGVHGLGIHDGEAAKLGADVFVSGLHKWMLAPRGTGLVWARPGVWATMTPTAASFSAMDLYADWAEERPPQNKPHAAWFSLGGFQAFEHVWRIATAVALHDRIGRAKIAARVTALNVQLRDALAKMSHVEVHTPRDPVLAGGITAFEVAGLTPDQVVEKLRARKIVASTSPYKVTYARLSFGLANSERDVETSIAAVAALKA